MSTPSRALCPPLDRNHRSPLAPAPAAPETALEIEHLRRPAQSDPQQRFWGQQRDVEASGAIDLGEVA